MTAERLRCSLCNAELSGGRDTYGFHDWPLCQSCKWDDYDMMNDYKNGIDGLYCCEVGRVLHLTEQGYRLSYPCDFTPPDSLCCPECAGPLYVEIHEWDNLTGFPTSAGVLVGCESERTLTDEERDADGKLWGIGHRFWQSDWQGVTSNATNWVMRECYRRLRTMAEGIAEGSKVPA